MYICIYIYIYVYIYVYIYIYIYMKCVSVYMGLCRIFCRRKLVFIFLSHGEHNSLMSSGSAAAVGERPCSLSENSSRSYLLLFLHLFVPPFVLLLILCLLLVLVCLVVR